MTEAALIWVAKGAGALAGSIISLAYVLPRGRREAALRATVGITTGLVFGTPAGIRIAKEVGVLGNLSPVEVSLMGAAAASLCAWWGLGVLSRLSEKLGSPSTIERLTRSTHSKHED